jgi:hypothetical protein
MIPWLGGPFRRGQWQLSSSRLYGQSRTAERADDSHRAAIDGDLAELCRGARTAVSAQQ